MLLVCLVCTEKDVARTDRTHAFFNGDNNPNISVLHDILLTHCMYNFDLGQFSTHLSSVFDCLPSEHCYIDTQSQTKKVVTCSAVVQHCVKAHMQSQWRKPKFDPP